MVFTPHMLVGAAIGSQLDNIWLAFLLSLIGHYLVDMIPHWEYKAAVIKRPIHVVWLLTDGLLGFSIILFLLWGQLFPLNYKTLVITGSVFLAQLPDLILFLELNFKTKWTRLLNRMHHRIHNDKEPSFLKALPGLAIVVSISILIILWG